MRRKVFRGVYTRGLDGWSVDVPALPACRAKGRSLAEARRGIADAVANLDPDAELEHDIRLEVRARAAIRRVLRAREKASAAEAELRAAQQEACRVLTETCSLRDAGELLGLSHQGVKKILATAPAPKARARQRRQEAR